jgi:hypothetical protein
MDGHKLIVVQGSSEEHHLSGMQVAFLLPLDPQRAEDFGAGDSWDLIRRGRTGFGLPFL